MTKFWGAVLAALMMTITAQAASAATLFDFSFTARQTNGDVFSGAGQFVTDLSEQQPGEDEDGNPTLISVYTIIGATGMAQLSGLAPVSITGLSDFASPVNSVFQLTTQAGSDAVLLGVGLTFSGVPDFYTFALDADSGTYIAGNGELLSQDVDFNVSAAAAVPEPATWAMMLLGFAIMGAAMRRRGGRIAFA